REINEGVDEGKEDGVRRVSDIEGNIVKKIGGKSGMDEVGRIKKEGIDERGDGRREEKEGGKGKVEEGVREGKGDMNEGINN
ncbi:hypothetical protein, partial [Staphylococcus hominis]|uniref:hypothetical protein n=1 Tax=Staphylococcus hominis TaxID=1290 RepID=UPI0016438D28